MFCAFRCHILHTARVAVVFFFSSRRRHTRLTCDWSSDVCSSDLIDDFAGNGLDSTLAFVGTGAPASAVGLDPAHGAAFAGINPLMGQGEFQFPIGRSVYNGLQTSYKQNINNPFPGSTGMSLQISYTLSRFKGNGSDDQNFNPVAWDFRNPTRFFGPTSLDRTHQFKFGVSFDIAHHGPRLSMVGGISSAPPSTLKLQLPGGDNSAQTTL